MTGDASDQSLKADIERLSQDLVRRFSGEGYMVATAESCTGGLIAGAITDVPGSSSVLDRGFVTYSNEAKMEMIGVSPDTLKAYGAVSEQTAGEMAQGALSHSRADLTVAVTGIAGPGGGSPDKPVGLIYMATAKRGYASHVRELRFDENWSRTQIRAATVRAALDALIKLLD